MARGRTTKELAERIDLNYFKRPHPLRRWMRRLILSAAALAGAWLIVEAIQGDHQIYEPGPVSPAHTLFGRQCTLCHAPLAREIYWRRVSDQACLACHDGPIHHPTQTFTPQCASCHMEHRGRSALARVEDAHCTRCHGDLKITGPSPHAAQCLIVPHRLERRVDNFNTAHPEFAVLRTRYQDAAQIKLNHQVHLKPNLKGLEKIRHDPGVTVEDGRYILTCSYCHQPDRQRAYMQAIQYEKHCLVCHPLLFDARFPGLAVPHEKVEVVIPFVREKFSQYILDHPEEIRQRRIELARRRPGEPRYKHLPATAQAWVDRQVEKAQSLLFRKTCVECHTLERKPDHLPVIVKPNIPHRWLVHSQFSHQSHRLLMCTACHRQAPTSQRTTDVLLPDIESCRTCHRAGGARADCAQCHTYHDKAKERPLGGTFTLQPFRR